MKRLTSVNGHTNANMHYHRASSRRIAMVSEEQCQAGLSKPRYRLLIDRRVIVHFRLPAIQPANDHICKTDAASRQIHKRFETNSDCAMWVKPTRRSHFLVWRPNIEANGSVLPLATFSLKSAHRKLTRRKGRQTAPPTRLLNVCPSDSMSVHVRCHSDLNVRSFDFPLHAIAFSKAVLLLFIAV